MSEIIARKIYVDELFNKLSVEYKAYVDDAIAKLRAELQAEIDAINKVIPDLIRIDTNSTKYLDWDSERGLSISVDAINKDMPYETIHVLDGLDITLIKRG